ncbi:uncharacterized protein LOC123304964 [Chrysoperla carnea]|uniref:uncharacterized protein LOC123304964 n=1 Tax=Chrysoperla carnea TaxID=189513 RepID=UPI001D076E54|nr:uncharacterized protein LOC123304964 [Chrysoperla carnea]
MTRYCLLWDNHNTNLVHNLTKLYEARQYLDITLRCENADIGVHKCVLVAASLYFEEQLRKNSSSTVILIKSIQLKILKLLIEFIYKGEIYVEESDVPSVLVAAKFFQISGLSGINSHDLDESFEDIPTQFNNFEEPEFIQTQVIEDVLNDLSTYKTERSDIISNTNLNLNTLSQESNEKSFEENSIFLQEKISGVNFEITETTNEEIVNEEYTETEVEAIAEEYLDSVSEMKIESHENIVVTSTSDKNISNSKNEVVVPDEEHFEDEEYLEEHLESFDEESLTYPDSEKCEDPETNKALQVLQEAGVPTDVPIYCEGNDGSFVELTKDILEEIASGGQVIYQVVDEEGKPGELLLGSAVKQQSRIPTPHEPEISTNVVYDKLVSETLYTPSPSPSLGKTEIENVTSQLIENVETVENDVKEQPIKTTRERKANSRYFNSNLTSPFLELSQRKAQKRTQSPKEQNGCEKIIKTENVENSECDLIEQKIAELHADFSTDLTNYMTTVNDNQTENEDISEILNDSESNDINIVKLASKRRKNKHFLKLFDSPKISTENNDDRGKIISSKRKKTNSETSNTSSQSTGREIPYALGLLPLRKALKKIQNMPDHTPRKTRSNVLLNKTQ